MVLNKDQAFLISDFFADVAKGLIVNAAVGSVAIKLPPLIRISILVFNVTSVILLLRVAIQLRGNKNNYEQWHNIFSIHYDDSHCGDDGFYRSAVNMDG